MRSRSQAVPAAVPPPELRPWLTPLSESGLVVHRFATGFYVSSPSVPLLPVLGSGALRLPHGFSVPGLSAAVLERIEPGARVDIRFRSDTDGELLTCGLRLSAVRQWRPAQLAWGSLPAAPDESLLRLCAAVLTAACPGIDGLDERVGRFAAAPTAENACDLVGLGPGSTPSGDDALCGALLALRALGARSALSQAAAALAAARVHERTTVLSSQLLRAAATGYCLPEVQQAFRHLHAHAAGGTAAEQAAGILNLVDAIGHHSGHDLIVGAITAILSFQHRHIPAEKELHREPAY